MPVELLRAIMAGRQPAPPDLLRKAAQVWPVNERDFAPIHDDLPEGVHVMRHAESVRSSRVLWRGGAPYYEYRDTAMTRLSLLRPEWIKLLRTAGDQDPENAAVVWNHGHFLYQFTFFVGECNYYYEWGGKRYCVPMTTGDSVFGLPFVKHTFASRNPDAPGHILALTFSGRLGGDTRQECAALGPGAAFAASAQAGSQGSLLAHHAANGAYSIDFLAAESGVPRERIARAINEEEPLGAAELQSLADALHIPVRELLAPASDTVEGIVLVRASQARSWYWPDRGNPSYGIAELAGSRVTPHTKSLQLDIVDSAAPARPWTTGLYQYGYNHGAAPVTLSWVFGENEYSTVLEPDDSFVMKPRVSHRFGRDGMAGKPASILLLRAGGRMDGDATVEASMIGPESMQRVVEEIGCWYDEE